MKSTYHFRYVVFILFSKKRLIFDYYVLNTPISKEIRRFLLDCQEVELLIDIFPSKTKSLPKTYKKDIVEIWQSEVDTFAKRTPAIVVLDTNTRTKQNSLDKESNVPVDNQIVLRFVLLRKCSKILIYYKRYRKFVLTGFMIGLTLVIISILYLATFSYLTHR